MKHNFKTLLILFSIGLPWGIFAQKTQLPDYLPPYVPPHQSPFPLTQERNGMPDLLTDSTFYALFGLQSGETTYTVSVSFDYNTSNKISNSIKTTVGEFNLVTTTRSTYFYNPSNGKLEMEEIATQNDTNWIPKEKTVYSYDSSTNFLIEVEKIDYINGEKNRIIYVNNSSGFVLEGRFESELNSEFKLYYRTIISRNADNKPTLIESESYNLATGVISGGNRTIHEYDAAGNRLVYISQLLNATTLEWDNSYKRIDTYTSNNLSATIEHSYPSLSNPTEWKPAYGLVQTYNNQIELDSIIEYESNGSGLQPLKLTLHQYANGELIKDSSFALSFNQWNIVSRKFHKPSDDIYSIALGIIEGTEEQSYNNGVWTTVSYTINEYSDLGNNLVQSQYKSILLNDDNILSTYYYYNAYYHNISPVSTNETLHNKSTTIAPNPYKTGQTIRCIGLENSSDLTFSLYDLAGALLSEQNFDGGSGLVLPAKVGAGMYIAVIRQGALRLKTTKIVVVD